MLYDGDCRFCRANVRFLQKADRGRRLTYVPMRGAAMREMVIVDKSGRRHSGGDAVRYLTRKLPVFWPFAIILHIPGTRRLWAWLYRKIAARRYWFGRITCDSEAPADWNNMMLGSASVEDNEVYNAIGEEGFQRLVAAFYKQVPDDDILGPMYPKDDMHGAEERLRDFLIFRFGGPQRYIEAARTSAPAHASCALRGRTGSARSMGATDGRALSEAQLPAEAEGHAPPILRVHRHIHDEPAR